MKIKDIITITHGGTLAQITEEFKEDGEYEGKPELGSVNLSRDGQEQEFYHLTNGDVLEVYRWDGVILIPSELDYVYGDDWDGVVTATFGNLSNVVVDEVGYPAGTKYYKTMEAYLVNKDGEELDFECYYVEWNEVGDPWVEFEFKDDSLLSHKDLQ